MPNEVSANQVLANEAPAPLPEVALSEPDYRAFCAALEASARGRAFLAEYARRNRQADTATVLAALDRLETLVRSQNATARAPSALPPEVAALVMVDKELAVEAARSHLAVVPRTDEPELPIPAPAGGPQPAIALVHDPEKWEPVFGQDHAQTKYVQVAAIAPPEPEVAPPAQDITQRSVAIIPEVNLFDGAAAKAIVSPPPCGEGSGVGVVVERQSDCLVAATPLPNPPPTKGRSRPSSTGYGGRELTEIAAAAPPADPLAHIMALSDEERLALFT